jgi:hypothetical protein
VQLALLEKRANTMVILRCEEESAVVAISVCSSSSEVVVIVSSRCAAVYASQPAQFSLQLVLCWCLNVKRCLLMRFENVCRLLCC